MPRSLFKEEAMQTQARMTRYALAGGVLFALAGGCAPGTEPSIGSEIQVLFNNQTGRTISVTVDGPSFSPTTVSVFHCAIGGLCFTDEFPGVAGDVISFEASAPAVPGGAPAASGSGTCRATADIVATPTQQAAAGQVEFHLGGTTISVVCTAGTGSWQ
jgi:hypothetical protein